MVVAKLSQPGPPEYSFMLEHNLHLDGAFSQNSRTKNNYLNAVQCCGAGTFFKGLRFLRHFSLVSIIQETKQNIVWFDHST